MAKLAKLAHEFLTSTGLPYEVSEVPALQRRGDKGLVIRFDGKESFYYPYQRQWWEFSTGLYPESPLEPFFPMDIRSNDWPLALPLMVVSSMLFDCRSILFPAEDDLSAKSQRDNSTSDELAALENYYDQGVLLLELAIAGRMRLNTRAVVPRARDILAVHTIASPDPSAPGVRPVPRSRE